MQGQAEAHPVAFRGDRQEAMGSVAAVLVRRDAWPAPGGWEATALSGTSWWITFAAYRGGIEILELAMLGEPSCTRWGTAA